MESSISGKKGRGRAFANCGKEVCRKRGAMAQKESSLGVGGWKRAPSGEGEKKRGELHWEVNETSTTCEDFNLSSSLQAGGKGKGGSCKISRRREDGRCSYGKEKGRGKGSPLTRAIITLPLPYRTS